MLTMVVKDSYFKIGASTRAHYIKNNLLIRGSEVSDDELYENVSLDVELVLKELQISASRLGYKYWKEAIFIFIMHDMTNPKVCKEIYPAIAKKYNKSAVSIERAMRLTFEATLHSSEKMAVKTPVYIALKSLLLFPKNSVLVIKIVELITTKEFQKYKINSLPEFNK